MMLKATKTSLYKLCQHYWPDMPKMKETRFHKLTGKRSWWLEFYQNSYRHSIYLSSAGGKAFIEDNWTDTGDGTSARETHFPPLEMLRELGMIKD